LITTLARSQNTGMEYDRENNELINLGKPPLLLEPIELKLNFKSKRDATIHILDHQGARTGKTIEMNGGEVALSGTLHKTFYYELVWD
jgi:hypothetical protein